MKKKINLKTMPKKTTNCFTETIFDLMDKVIKRFIEILEKLGEIRDK